MKFALIHCLDHIFVLQRPKHLLVTQAKAEPSFLSVPCVQQSLYHVY